MKGVGSFVYPVEWQPKTEQYSATANISIALSFLLSFSAVLRTFIAAERNYVESYFIPKELVYFSSLSALFLCTV